MSHKCAYRYDPATGQWGCEHGVVTHDPDGKETPLVLGGQGRDLREADGWVVFFIALGIVAVYVLGAWCAGGGAR